MISCARVLIFKILLPSPANVGMIGLVRPAPQPAATAPLSSESEEASSISLSASSSELSSVSSSSAVLLPFVNYSLVLASALSPSPSSLLSVALL